MKWIDTQRVSLENRNQFQLNRLPSLLGVQALYSLLAKMRDREMKSGLIVEYKIMTSSYRLI